MNFIKGLAANPKTTAMGILALAATTGKCYLMATGKMPVDPETVSTALGLLSTGAGLIIAKDGKATPLAEVAKTASALAPFASTIQQTIEVEGNKAKDQKIADLTAQVSQVLPK